MKRSSAAQARSRCAGFTLVELSMVLVVVALIIGAVTAGMDLQRNATYQRISATFVRGWQMAFISHAERTGRVPGDTASPASGKVRKGTGELCGLDLRNAMYAAGVRMPQGRAEGSETHYGYLDSNGNPQDLEVCMRYVKWLVPGSSAGQYVVQQRNVLVLKRMTPDLARLIDSLIDGTPDAQFGGFREAAVAGGPSDQAVGYVFTTVASRDWSLDARYGYSGAPANRDEQQVAVVTGYYLMDPE